MFSFTSAVRRCARLLAVSALALVVSGCGSDDHDTSLLELARLPVQSEPDFSNLAVHNPSGPFNSVLLGCVTADAVEDSCTLEALPLLGQQTGGADPTVDQVMDRVVVSHPWMAERFREVLQELEPDIRTLLKGVSAIVIDDDIRPSFYYTLTGAIYLDPDFLWRTPSERETVSRQEDFRSDFVRQLNFAPLWRFTLNNGYAIPNIPGPAVRTLDDILYDVASLLYHELAHANDFLPPEKVTSLDPKLPVIESVARLKGSWVSDELKTQHPLTSVLWPALGQVIYKGATANGAQRSLTASEVGNDFEADKANDDYAYSHPAEDVSMLFEETMMKLHYSLERDIAFASWPPSMDYVCDDFVVGWGNRNRIGNPAVKVRAQLVASKLLPGTNFAVFFSQLPQPTLLAAGRGWCANLNPTGAPSPLSLREVDMNRQLQRDLSPPHER